VTHRSSRRTRRDRSRSPYTSRSATIFLA